MMRMGNDCNSSLPLAPVETKANRDTSDIANDAEVDDGLIHHSLHSTVRAEGPERIAGEWWRRAVERAAVRDYYRVEDEAGDRFWLYRRGDGMRLETGDLSWFLHGKVA